MTMWYGELDNWRCVACQVTPRQLSSLLMQQVYDPLVEKQKEKFNKMQQRNKKLMTEWAGRSAT